MKTTSASEMVREFLKDVGNALPPVSLWQRLKCLFGFHRWFRETSTASYCLYCHKYKSHE